jgi:hypothetical protein
MGPGQTKWRVLIPENKGRTVTAGVLYHLQDPSRSPIAERHRQVPFWETSMVVPEIQGVDVTDLR